MKRSSFFFLLALYGALVFAFSPSGISSPSLITRYPYLQNMTSHSVLIAWRTLRPVVGGVDLSAISPDTHLQKGRFYEPTGIRTQEPRASTHHAILLSHLLPATTYRYQIDADSQALTGWIKFKTFPEGSDASFSFAVVGDSGTGNSYQKKIAHEMYLVHPDFVIHTGDVIYGGKDDADFDSKFFSIYRASVERIPWFLSLGNHDAALDHGIPYLRNFYLPQNSPGKGRYYSFDCAQGHFVALDSNESMSPESEQYRWLKEDLKHSMAPFKVIFFHHPLYSTGFHGSSTRLREVLEPLFRRYHVTLVLNGHDHDYERSVPIHGITYVVTGGGGGTLYPAMESSWTAHSELDYNFVYCEVSGTKVHLRATNEDGKIFDEADVPVNSGI